MFSWRKFVSFIEEPFLTGFRYPMEKTDYITKYLFLCILLGKYGGAPANSRNSNYCVPLYNYVMQTSLTSLQKTHSPFKGKSLLINDQIYSYNQLLQLCTARTAWSDSDQAMRTMHSCNSW